MTLKPCLSCGELSPASRCPEHRLKDKRKSHTKSHARDHVHTNPARWKRLSQRCRKRSPFCERCGATGSLTTDHILPVSEYPELAYVEQNLSVLCRSCNSKRGNNFTAEEAQGVVSRLESAYKRRRIKSVRLALEVAQKAAQGRGIAPPGGAFRPRWPRQSLRYTPQGV